MVVINFIGTQCDDRLVLCLRSFYVEASVTRSLDFGYFTAVAMAKQTNKQAVAPLTMRSHTREKVRPMVYIYSPIGNPTNSKLKQIDRYDNLDATHNKGMENALSRVERVLSVALLLFSLFPGFACCAWRSSPTDKHARIQRNPLAQLLADGAQKVILPNANRPGVLVISMVMAFFFEAYYVPANK